MYLRSKVSFEGTFEGTEGTFVRWYSTTRNWAVVVDLRTLHSLTLKALSELYIWSYCIGMCDARKYV